jgi:pimeloyl-ACP methyl ester carboxylesterase
VVSQVVERLVLPSRDRKRVGAFACQLVLAFAASSLHAQVPLTFASDVDRSQQAYALYIPKSFAPAKKYPLLISLHSEESNHRLNMKQVFGVSWRYGELDPISMRYSPPLPDADFFVACPLSRGTMGYQGIAEKDVYDVLAEVERQYPIDPDRVYLTGIGMGGAGALRLALTRPAVWAAVMPLCPSPQPALDELAPNALNLPIHLVQGELDPVVPVQSLRNLHRLLLNLRDPVEYFEYPLLRHNTWDVAYKEGAGFDWFGKFRRNRFPDHVRFVTRSFRYSSAYWVRMDRLMPGTLASIDARRTNNQVQVTTSALDAFTITLDRPVTAVTIDGAAVRIQSAAGRPAAAKPAASLSFVKTARGWALGAAPPTGKHLGAEGPIAAAVEDRHIYVYGTLGTRTAAELDDRRRLAQQAAAWSNAREHLMLNLQVKPDSEVTDIDMDFANMVLFGTAETNSIIARIAAKLPLALSPGAADYGLLFIAPLGRRYVLVSSGLPWWTGTNTPTRGADPFLPSQYRLLSTLGDYILFRGSLANPVEEGRFDLNWKVAPEAAAKLQSTGIVTVK